MLNDLKSIPVIYERFMEVDKGIAIKTRRK